MRTYLHAKGLVGTRGGGGYDVLKIFPICIIQKSDHFSPKIKPYIHGNRKSNAKLSNRGQQGAYISRWKHLIDFNFYQNYKQQYTVIPITTVRGPFYVSFCRVLIFILKINLFSNKYIGNTIRMSNSVDPDQTRHFFRS